MTKLERRHLFAAKLAELICLADTENIRIAPFSVYRTAEEQRKLYDQGKSKCDGYIKRSRHQDWLACDWGILNDAGTDFLWSDKRYDRLGELAVKVGLVWGGNWDAEKNGFSDPYHVELPENV